MSVFRFKEFEIDQAGCAMRINTDGVLLGAMANAEQARNMLDIGAGTGVIALMLAQRFAKAQISAVEIDESSASTAIRNVQQSPFSDRVTVHHQAFQSFVPAGPIDLIITNPPFYVNALHNPDARKKQARHADMDFFEDLLRYAKAHLSDRGVVEMIIPAELSSSIIALGRQYGLALHRKIAISSFEDSPCIRHIIRLGVEQKEISPQQSTFVIYASKGVYSAAYRAVLKPFFLAF